ncbi:MAG: hypothetical protein IID36_10490, partial [Planctomycetes bacterium]|nr:hypothetical protein [Planctomycetota bacterium]
MRRDVVISGLGSVTGFGYGAEALWEGLCAGRSAVRRIERFDPSGMPCQVGAEVVGFSAKDHVPKTYRKAVKVMARDIELAVGAAKAAVEYAGIYTKGLPSSNGQKATYAPRRVGCQIGAELIAAEIPELTMAFATATNEDGSFDYGVWGETGMNNLTPLWLLKYLPNMPSCHFTIIHEACGPSNTITCGEASGLLSIGESMRVIERGDADLCFSGGAESKINEMGLLRMDFAGRVAPIVVGKDEPFDGTSIARPFDLDSPGGAVGEGGGIVLVEARDALRDRGGKVVASLLGFGAGHSPRSADARVRAEGLVSAIERAMNEAGAGPDDIDAIVPHGAGVRDVDAEEAEALRAVFGSSLSKIPLVTWCGAVGETMAGTGGIATCVGAMCLERQTLPARFHAGTWPDDLDVGPVPTRSATLRRLLVCT